MGTRLIESKQKNILHDWFNDYTLKTRSIENFFLILFFIGVPMFFNIIFSGVEVNGHYIPYIKAIISSDDYRNERLIGESREISGLVYKKEAYLETLRDNKLDDVQYDKVKKESLEEIQGYSDVGVVVLDTTTGALYSNKSWFYDMPYNFKTAEEIIKALENEEGMIARKIAINPRGFEEIYFARTQLFDSEITGVMLSTFISALFVALVVVLLSKKILMLNKLGFKLYRDSFRWGYLKKMKNAWLTLLDKNLMINEILRDRVVWVVIGFVILSLTLISFLQFIGLYMLDRFYSLLVYGILIGGFVFIILHFIIKILYRYEGIEFVVSNLDSIKNGDFDIDVVHIDDKQLQRLSKGINDIRIRYKKSIEEGIAAEKLKTELISNVSHDLKTPLTSIINYVNIIQRDDISEQERRDYMGILEKKSNRLRDLIEDLFEVSKMNSGKIKLDKYDIDIVQLVHQSIGELEDYEKEKNMEFKIRGLDEMTLNLDGMRMSRVFQNLATNALKYGLPNTRVYVDIEDTGFYVRISFKNISSYELDFDEKEIVERFSRADKSRNSGIEGSGLGLAITNSIVELHGGTFRVECEGDLFKAYVNLPKKAYQYVK